MWKGTLSLLAVSLTSTCLASFELALIYDWNTHSIFRYDPVSGQALGSFGAGEMGAYGLPALCVDAARPGQVAVLNHDGAVRRFNYSTGEYTSGVNLNTSFFGNTQMQLNALSNGNLLISGYFSDDRASQTRLYNGSTGALIAKMYAYSYDHLQSGQSSDGSLWSLTRVLSSSTYHYYLFRYTASGAYQGFVTVGSSSDPDYRYSMRIQGNTLYMIGAGSSPNPVKGTISGGSVSLTDLLGSYYVTTLYDNVMFGHNGRAHFTQTYESGGTRYNRWYLIDPITGYYYYTRLMPYDWRIYSTTLVVAPEPTSLLALAAGVGVLAARRRVSMRRRTR